MTTYNDEASVRKLHDEVLCAFNSLDLDKLHSRYSDNIVLLEPDMPAIFGKAEVIKLFKKFQQQKLVCKLSYVIHSLEVFGKSAFVHGQVISQTAQNDEIPAQETIKFVTLSQKQEDGRWLMHAIVNKDQQKFSFFGVRFKNGEGITKSTITHDTFPEEGRKDVSQGGPKDLVCRMILSIVNPVAQ